MRLLAISLLLLALVGCRQDQSVLASRNLSGTVLIINIPNGPASGPVSTKPEGGGLGTGFVIGENTIVTNNHVIAGGGTLRVYGYRDGKAYKASVIASDKDADLAVIRLEQWDEFRSHVRPTMLRWGDSRDVDVGDTVWSMGNPYGLTWTVAQGLVSHKLRQAKDDGTFYIQTTTQIYPGNSGGPLLDEQGLVVAVNSAIVGKEGYFGMAIPSRYARKVVDDLLALGRVERTRLGISISASDDEHGIKVGSISTKSRSIEAGLLPNDEITAISTRETGWRRVDVYDADGLVSEVALLDPGDTVRLYVLRDGAERVFSFPVVPADPT